MPVTISGFAAGQEPEADDADEDDASEISALAWGIVSWELTVSGERKHAMSSTGGASDWGFGHKKKRIHAGDGHALKPFRPWQLLSRSLFYAPLETADGKPRRYAVNVNYFDWDDKADLYLEGIHHAQSKLPAEFPVEGGTIEVATTTYGLKRMHFVDRTGNARVLRPDPASAEGMRAKLAQRAPGVSRLIGVLAVIILLTLLPFSLLQLVEMLTHVDFAQPYVDPFTSPIRLPDWASTPALILSILAALERALTLRSHWLIDMETGWSD